jgi:hypothetical protein
MKAPPFSLLLKTWLLFVLISYGYFPVHSTCAFPTEIYEWPEFDFFLTDDDGAITITLSGLDCQPCFFSSPTGYQICECRQECDAEAEATYVDCNEYCYEEHGQYEYNYNLLHACYEQCETKRLTDLYDCELLCGEVPTKREVSLIHLFRGMKELLKSDMTSHQTS